MIDLRGNRIENMMVATTGAGALVAVLAALDTRVRDLIAELIASDPARTFASASMRSQLFARSVMDTVGYQTLGYEPLIMFAVVGAVFLLLMLKM